MPWSGFRKLISFRFTWSKPLVMQNEAFVQEVVRLTNQFRARNGLPSLAIDIDLMEAAQTHVENMAFQDFFSHIGRDGSRPWDRAQAAGYETGIVGENIGVGYRTPEEIVNGWINSDSHRAAMLNPRYNEIGAGFYFLRNDTGNVNYNYYWAELFGQGEIEDAAALVEARADELPANFDPLQYGASNPDLIGVYGFDAVAFTQHYLDYGRRENRPLNSFDEYRYLASNGDLIKAFGANEEAATEHYVKYGYREGRRTDQFNPVNYLASYDDLLKAFGTNGQAATEHYVKYGYGEGRQPNRFNALQYVASYGDLVNVYGLNYDAATQHFVSHGYKEGRSRDRFKEDIYLASNADLITAFGYALETATLHYVQYGMGENRPLDAFNPVEYLNNYGDLQSAYGNDLVAATRHYIEHGMKEGRNWL
jgi:hypothetical protein